MVKKDNKSEKTDKQTEIFKFKGKYVSAIGRRKTATARIRLYKDGAGQMVVNGMKINDYLTMQYSGIAVQALKESGLSKDFDMSAVTFGGGKKAQAEAIRHGVSRALIAINADLKPAFRSLGFLTRDARSKERKKPGLRRARRAPQWSKR
jgi:small subunit ribosomal protein S9